MTVKGCLALLVGVFVVALLAVTLALGSPVDDRARARGLTGLLPLLATLAAVAVSLEDGPLHVTASIGVASGAEDGWEGLVRRADTGLYAAKEGGRDRVVAGPPAKVGSRTPGRENAAR
jgi:GGDEF domain-containing protein